MLYLCKDLVMAARVCGHCGNKTVLELRDFDISDPWRIDSNYAVVSAAYQCIHCRLFSVATLPIRRHMQSPPPANDEYVDQAVMAGGATWAPDKPTGREFPDVPENIAAVASEAYKSRSVDANLGAVLLARSVIEASAKTVGVTDGTLAAKIAKMNERSLLRPAVVSAADAIRESGNAVAHGDFAEFSAPLDGAEADEVLELMSLVLQDLFQETARAERVSAAAAARKTARES